MSESIEKNYKRNSPPSLPSGFKAFQLEENVLIVDFLTSFPEEVTQVFSSIVFTKDIAENLARTLENFAKGHDEADEKE